jgi:exopolysaccharide production protein ExoY
MSESYTIHNSPYTIVKRSVDILGALVGIVVFSPAFVFSAIAIGLDSPGPVIFIQTRVGRGGKRFGMYKFRSMLRNAEEILEKDPELMARYKAGSFKLEDDPRITRVGRFMRKRSIDEVPQLFNILRGEMSLVGPRALKPDELEEQRKKFPDAAEDVALALTVKPGLTGLWQVSGRSDVAFRERVKLDAEYARRRSLWEDIKILVKTPWVVLKGKGAC